MLYNRFVDVPTLQGREILMVHSGLIAVFFVAFLQIANAEGDGLHTENAEARSEPGKPVSVENQRTESNVQYGKFDVSRTMSDLIDLSTIESLSDGTIANEDVTWRMYVPDSYTPSEPAGLLVYVSPTPKGQMPRGWQPVLDEQNLIFISADRSGNKTRTKRRMLYAALAPYVVSDNYEIDASRIYLSGFSGGGKVASLAAIQFANLFTGAIYICGAESWLNVGPTLLSEAKQNRYVFVTGSRDFNRTLTRRIFKNYEEEGMTNINLMIIPGMRHETPDELRFRTAINYLDQRE